MKYNWGNIYTSILNIVKIFKNYMVKLFFPYRLAHRYFVDVSLSLKEPEVIISLIISLIFIIIILYSIFRKKKSAWFAGLLFIACYIPVANLIPLIIQADRYMFLPLWAFAMALALVFILLLKWKREMILIVGVIILFYSGLTFTRNIKWENTETLVMDSLRDPNYHPTLWYQLAHYYIKSGMRNEAKDAALQAQQQMPWYDQPYYMLGEFYEEEGRLDKAVECYNTLLEMGKDTTSICGRLVKLYVQKKQFNMAIQYYNMMEEGTVEKLVSGVRIFRKTDKDLSSRYISELMSHDDLSRKGTVFVLQSLLESGNLLEAIKWVKDMRSSTPEIVSFRKLYIDSIAANDVKELDDLKQEVKDDISAGLFGLAIDKLEFIHLLDSQYVTPYLDIGEHYLGRGDYTEALYTLADITHDTRKDSLFFLLASIYDSMRVFNDSAAFYYKRVLETTDDVGLRDRAEGRLKIVTSRKPSLKEMYAMAMEYYHQEQYDLALPIYLKILDYSSDQANLLNMIGNTLINLGRPEEAIGYWKRVLELEPNSVDAVFNLGLAYARLSNSKQAAEYFEKFLKIAPEGDNRVSYVKRWLFRFE